MPSGGLEHGDVGVVAVEADGGVGPVATDGVTADDGQTEVGEEGDRLFEVADGDADVSSLTGMHWNAIERGIRSGPCWFADSRSKRTPRPEPWRKSRIYSPRPRLTRLKTRRAASVRKPNRLRDASLTETSACSVGG